MRSSKAFGMVLSALVLLLLSHCGRVAASSSCARLSLEPTRKSLGLGPVRIVKEGARKTLRLSFRLRNKDARVGTPGTAVLVTLPANVTLKHGRALGHMGGKNRFPIGTVDSTGATSVLWSHLDLKPKGKVWVKLDVAVPASASSLLVFEAYAYQADSADNALPDCSIVLATPPIVVENQSPTAGPANDNLAYQGYGPVGTECAGTFPPAPLTSPSINDCWEYCSSNRGVIPLFYFNYLPATDCGDLFECFCVGASCTLTSQDTPCERRMLGEAPAHTSRQLIGPRPGANVVTVAATRAPTKVRRETVLVSAFAKIDDCRAACAASASLYMKNTSQ